MKNEGMNEKRRNERKKKENKEGRTKNQMNGKEEVKKKIDVKNSAARIILERIREERKKK